MIKIKRGLDIPIQGAPQQVIEEVRNYFKDKVFGTIIPRAVKISEAPSFGQPINLYAPNSPGAVAYKVLAAELVKGDMPAKSAATGVAA